MGLLEAPRRRRVLIVDDDIDTLHSFARILCIEGIDVVTADAGHTCLELLHSRRDIDLVLADLRMPEMSGLELLAEVVERWPDMPVILFSAWASRASECAARQLGAADVVDKSWDHQEFWRVIQKHLRPAALPELAREARDSAGHATLRWTSIVSAISTSDSDLPTLADWAAELHKSIGTIKRWCHVCGVSAGDSLDFARALRVVVLCAGRPCHWYEVLAIVEPVTMRRFLMRSGFSVDAIVPDVITFLSKQQFVTNTRLLNAISKMPTSTSRS